MREGNLVILSNQGDIKETAVIGNEPIHMCSLGPHRVLATSTNAYLYHTTASHQVTKQQVALNNTRLLCALGQEIVAVTTDLSIASIAQKFDYHLTLETLKKCPNTVKRMLSLGPFVTILLENSPYSLEVIDAVSATWKTLDSLPLVPQANYYSLFPGQAEDIVYVAGEQEKKGILHVCKLFPAAVVSTTRFECPIFAAVSADDYLYIGAGPQLFLAKLASDFSVQSLCSLRVSDTVSTTQIVDLHLAGSELLVTQLTFGVLIYTANEEKLVLTGRGRLHNQLLSAGVIWGDSVICLSKEGTLFVLGKGVNCSEMGEFGVGEGGRKLLVTRDAQRVVVFTLCGSVFVFTRDEGGVCVERQRAVLESCSQLERTDFQAFRVASGTVRTK